MISLIVSSLFFLSSAAASDPFESSLEGWHHQHVLYLKSPDKLETTQILKKVKTDFLDKPVEVALNIQAPDKPLIVVLPGLFGNYDTVEARRVAQLVLAKGFNTLRIPNPVSRQMIRLGTHYPGLDFESEGKMIAQIVQNVENEYHFSEVDFAGVSYGAFISAVASAEMGPDYHGKVLLVSPPRDMLESLQKMDGYFDEMQNKFNEIPWKPLGLLIEFYWKRFLREDMVISPEAAKETLVIGGFHRTFVELTELHEQTVHPRSWLWRFYKSWTPAVRKQHGEMRFIPFVRATNPKFFDDPEKHDVRYWVKKSGAKDWLLFTADNDFINTSKPWEPSPHVVVYHDGGHVFGYMTNGDFIKRLQDFF